MRLEHPSSVRCIWNSEHCEQGDNVNRRVENAEAAVDNLRGATVPVDALTGRERDQMYSLMFKYYANVDRSAFDADLNEKQWVIRLIDRERNQILGFSTQMLLAIGTDSDDAAALFSGDTIVDRDYWARNELARMWGRFALSLIDAHPARPLYWFLIAKGYKTYRFLPTFFHEFYPRYDVASSTPLKQIVDQLAMRKYPTRYDSRAGIITADRDACCLRSGVADVTHERLRDPHVRFFVERNPGHVDGDELCCLAPLTRDNFTRAAYRVIGSAEGCNRAEVHATRQFLLG